MGKGLDRTLLQWGVHPLGVLSPPWARPAWCQLLPFTFPWVSMVCGGEHPSLGEQGRRRNGGVDVSPVLLAFQIFSPLKN